jgi:hypothetical protein
LNRTTRTARRVLGTVVALTIVATGAVLVGTPASARVHAAQSRRVTFGVQPATSHRPDSRPNLSYGVTPGSTVRDHVAIVNFSSGPLVLSVYATDAINTSTGGFSLLTGDQQPKDAGAWTSVDGRKAGEPVTVKVPARHTSGPGFVILPLVLHVPASAGPGDHVGGVVAVLSTIGTNSQGTKVRLDQRLATRLFVRVSGPAKPHLAVEHLAATYHAGFATLGKGTATVTFTVHNTGNVSLGAKQSVHVSGIFGLGSSTTSVPDVALLLPGASVRERVVVRGVLPLVWMSATVTLHPTHPAGAIDPGLVSRIVADVSFWALPWALLLLVLAAVAAGWWRRRRRVAATSPVRPTARRGSRMPEAAGKLVTKRAAVGVALLAIGWSVVGAGTSAAMAADGPPYSDPRATSSLALCGKDGKQVTSGSTKAQPFVWRAVSASSAPRPYNKAGRTATLFAYQPRPQVDAGEWSGELITASARYTDASHPMAAATELDGPLSDFLDDFPTKLDGFVQLRLYLGAPDEPAYTLKYAAANIRVSGTTWRLVGTPPKVSCTSGTAISLEAILATAAPSAHATASPRATPAASTPQATPTASAPGAAGSVASESAAAAAAAAARRSSSDGNGNGWRIAAIAAGLAVLVAGAITFWWLPLQRRRARAG